MSFDPNKRIYIPPVQYVRYGKEREDIKFVTVTMNGKTFQIY
jgi:hypothetical protein